MIWVVVGGQYGSEGKGAFCAYLARGYGFRAAVRGGGPQAGHTFWDERYGGKCVVRQVPVASIVDSKCLGYIGPGAIVDFSVLEEEMVKYGLTGRVFVHPAATVLLPEHKEHEESASRAGGIPGSTREGVGAARSERAMRTALQVADYRPACGREWIDRGLFWYDRILEWGAGPERVMAEGAQGFGLSNYHGAYPYVTSADTTPGAVLSECGLPVTCVERVVVVVRTFPIRVGGESGPFRSAERTWAEIGVEPERTTVTKRERRIAEFEWSEFDRMLRTVRPTHAALMFCDYLDPSIREKPIGECPRVLELWREVNKRVPCPWIGVGGEKFEVRGAMDRMVMARELGNFELWGEDAR